MSSALDQFEWVCLISNWCPSGYGNILFANLGWFLVCFLFCIISMSTYEFFNPLGMIRWYYCQITLFMYNVLVNLYFNVSPPIISVLLLIYLNILSGNFIGMVPFTTAIFSSLAITFILSLSTFISIIFLTVMQNKMDSFKTFVPSEVPLLLLPLLVIIEFISFFSRVFSLAIRLFANILAGHILLKILVIGLAYASFETSNLLISLSVIFPLVIIFVIILLEFLVAALQSYVFTLLCSLFLKEGLNIGSH